MEYQSPAERVAHSFSAWEIRGRGWQLADYPVELEPVFRPFFLLLGTVADGVVIDDGKRPTIASSIISFARAPIKALTSSTPSPPAPYIEPSPYEASSPPGGLRFLSVTVPTDFKSASELTGQLLLALGTSLHPVTFELIGERGRVRLQFVVAGDEAAYATALLNSYFPEAFVSIGHDALEAGWQSATHRMVVDFGLSDEFFLPLACDDQREPYLSLIPALASAANRELVAIQVSFQRCRNAWAPAVREVVGESESDCLFSDAPHFARLAKQKTATPLFAVTLRLGLAASDGTSLRNLGRAVMPFIKSFERPGSNELIPLDNDDYPDDAHERGFLSRETYRTGMILSTDELTALVHLPDASIQSEALVREQKRTRELPQRAVGDLVLGHSRHGDSLKAVTLSVRERLLHTHLVGATGVGKSTLIHALALQDIAAGRGIAVLDPAGDLIDDIARAIPKSRASDVIYFDPADLDHPIGLGLFDAATELEKIALVDDITAVFQRLSTSWGDSMTTVLSNAVMAALEYPDGGTLLDIRRLLIDDDFRKQYLGCITDPEVRFFWQKQYGAIGSRSVGPILSRLDSFLRPKTIRNVVGVRRARMTPAQALASGKIFLAKLPVGILGEQNSYLLGSLLIAKLQQAAMARQSQEKEAREPFFLYVDEAHHFVTPSLISVLTGARKYAVGATLAHQHLGQLQGVDDFKSALLGNAYARLVFRVGESDAKELASGFAHFEAADLLNLGVGEAVGRFGEAGRDFSLHTVPQQSRSADSLPLDELRPLSRTNYASAVERQPIPETSDVAAERPEPQCASQPVEVAATPLGVTPPRPRDDGRKLTFSAPPADAGKGGREHRYIQQLIKRLGEDRGFRATIEHPVPDGRVDILLHRAELTLAFEISVTNSAEYEVGNVEKCLRADFSHVYFVCADAKRREKVRAAIELQDEGQRVAFAAPEDVVGVLDAFQAPPQTETLVKGYRVKINRPTGPNSEMAGKRAVIAEVIAKSLVR